MAAPWRGGVKWIFQTPRPSPTLHLLIQSPPLSQSRPGSAKCDLAPLIAGGAAVLARRRQRRPPSPGAQQPAGVADEGGKGPTLPNTHTYTRTHDGGGLGGFLAKLLVPGNGLGPRAHSVLVPPQASVPSPSPPRRLPSVGPPLPVTRPRPAGPAPGCSHPTPLGCSGRPGSVCTSLLPSGCCLPAPAQAPSPVGWDQSPKQLLLQPGLLVWKWAHLLPRGTVGQIDPSSHGRLGHPAD